MASPLAELARLFLRLGLTSFGGPAAHTAFIRDEVVRRRRWLTDEEFLDLVAATNLIPGPNSTELAMHIGLRRAGLAGLVVAGASFIVPAFCLVLAVAMGYARYGTTPDATWLLAGVTPVVVAIIGDALGQMIAVTVRTPTAGILVALATTASLLGTNELLVLLLAALLMLASIRHSALVSRRLALGRSGSTVAELPFRDVTPSEVTERGCRTVRSQVLQEPRALSLEPGMSDQG